MPQPGIVPPSVPNSSQYSMVPIKLEDIYEKKQTNINLINCYWTIWTIWTQDQIGAFIKTTSVDVSIDEFLLIIKVLTQELQSDDTVVKTFICTL